MNLAAIYFDHHATTPVDPRVLEAMLPYFTVHFANAGSISHEPGRQAAEAVEAARAEVAAALGAAPREIVFTSGATESNNLALRGLADRQRRRGSHLVSVRTEHKAVLDPLERLTRGGFEVTLLDVEPHGSPTAGRLPLEQLERALRDDTLAVSVMLANNEIGVVQPLAEICELAHRRGAIVHCDATQAVGKLPVDVDALGVDLLSFSAHKIYGPKGVGGIYVRRRPGLRLTPQQDGGGQEGGLRSGTLNVTGIVGLARALTICLEEMPREQARLAALRQRLYEGLCGAIEGVSLNGPALDARGDDGQLLRLPGNLNLSFAGVDGEALMMNTGRLAVSSGSACTSANPEPSHVLRALGLSEDLTRASLRFGLGRMNTESEVDAAVELLSEAVTRLRRLGQPA